MRCSNFPLASYALSIRGGNGKPSGAPAPGQRQNGKPTRVRLSRVFVHARGERGTRRVFFVLVRAVFVCFVSLFFYSGFPILVVSLLVALMNQGGKPTQKHNTPTCIVVAGRGTTFHDFALTGPADIQQQGRGYRGAQAPQPSGDLRRYPKSGRTTNPLGWATSKLKTTMANFWIGFFPRSDVTGFVSRHSSQLKPKH